MRFWGPAYDCLTRLTCPLHKLAPSKIQPEVVVFFEYVRFDLNHELLLPPMIIFRHESASLWKKNSFDSVYQANAL